MEDIKAGLYVLWRCMTILFLLLLTKARTHSSFNCKWLDPAIDIREKVGVKINKISGSRAEYIPFPFGYRMNPGDSVSLEFRTSSSHGLIFLAGNFDRADLASAYLRRGFVIFARRCAYGKAFESHSELLVDDGKWHKMIYNHTAEGGTLYVDGVEDVSYRTHYMGPCGSFNSLVFGGLSRKVYGTTGFRGFAEDEHEPDKIVKHRFSGCIRNLHFGNKWPVVPPKYYAVSQCSG